VSDGSISASTSLLRRLLDVASSFWTVADTESVLLVHIKESAHKRGQTQELLKSLGKQMAKKISTHVFIEAFVRVWKVIEQADNFTEEDIAFTVLRHAIKAADRLQIAQESRILLSVFLEAWDAPKVGLNSQICIVSRDLEHGRRLSFHQSICGTCGEAER
jgi:hypothetical protein